MAGCARDELLSAAAVLLDYVPEPHHIDLCAHHSSSRPETTFSAVKEDLLAVDTLGGVEHVFPADLYRDERMISASIARLASQPVRVVHVITSRTALHSRKSTTECGWTAVEYPFQVPWDAALATAHVGSRTKHRIAPSPSQSRAVSLVPLNGCMH